MKPLCVLALCLAAPVFSPARAETAPAVAMRDAATHEELAQRWRQAQQDDPTRQLEATKGPDPSTVNQPLDLISQSDILCFGGRATLVPKRAVLHVPPNLAERLKILPGSQIQSWADFYANNRGWITTLEVSRLQAEGNEPLADDVTKRLNDSLNLVVATYQSGPISVLSPKEPPPAKATDKTAAPATPTGKNKS